VSIALGIAAAGSVDAQSAVSAAAFQPRIVHGQATTDYSAAGALLLHSDTSATTVSGLCSGVLIGCRTFLTAAHCVCPDFTDNAADCHAEGLTDPRSLGVFLQSGGLVRVAAVAIAPTYAFAVGGDVAVVTLAELVSGVDPSPINTRRRLTLGHKGTAVGFGVTQGGRRALDDSGVKRAGSVRTAACLNDLPADTHVCWQFDGTNANTCAGDSGGPLFADVDGVATVTGITSGGYSNDCLAPDVGFASDVFVNRDWILSTSGEDLGAASCGMAGVGASTVQTAVQAGELTSAADHSTLQIAVPPGTHTLRVALNGQLGSGTGPSSTLNDFDLLVRAGGAPSPTLHDCADTRSSPFGFCEIAHPQAGLWQATVLRVRGAGTFQVVATIYAGEGASPCTGDCDGDGRVTVDEVQLAIDLANGPTVGACPGLDVDQSGSISMTECATAVANVLQGCPR